jgi:antitoxin HigA-1
MFKNGVRPVHPGEVLREDFLKPLGMSANALAKALRVPAPRINDVVRKRRGVSAVLPCASRAILAAMHAPG